MPRVPIDQVLARHSSGLMELPGVTGTGEGRRGEDPIFVVFVAERTPELEARVPKQIEGYPVEIRESGTVTAPPR